jgi:hypothetical protein
MVVGRDVEELDDAARKSHKFAIKIKHNVIIFLIKKISSLLA